MGCITSHSAPPIVLPFAPSAEEHRAASTIQRILVRQLDPITLRPIRRRFHMYRNGVMIPMDADTLFHYVSTSGDLSDPVCKEPYASHELMRMQRLVGRKLPSDLSERFETETNRSMILEFLVDDMIVALRDVMRETRERMSDRSTRREANAERDGRMQAIVLESVDNFHRLLRTSEERDWIVQRLGHAGMRHSALTPLTFLLFDDPVSDDVFPSHLWHSFV